MNSRWIGAILIVAGCGGCGFSIASGHRREVQLLREFLNAVRYMTCELQYKLTPLPELCRQAGREAPGTMRDVFYNFARELDWQISPDAFSCMAEAIEKSHGLTPRIRKLFLQLGRSLGRFDLSGQLKELEHLLKHCELEMQSMTDNQASRLRSYQTLGLCTGAALALLFL